MYVIIATNEYGVDLVPRTANTIAEATEKMDTMIIDGILTNDDGYYEHKDLGNLVYPSKRNTMIKHIHNFIIQHNLQDFIIDLNSPEQIYAAIKMKNLTDAFHEMLNTVNGSFYETAQCRFRMSDENEHSYYEVGYWETKD